MLAFIALLLLASHASIFSDIAGFLTGKFKNAAELAGKVWGALKHALNYVTGIFRTVGAAWGDLHFAFRTLISGLEHLAEGTYSAIRWLSQTLVPKGIRRAISDAIGWAERNIKTIAKRAEQLANDARKWASRRINSVFDTAKHLISAARKIASEAWDWIRKRGNKIWDIVMHPGKMVAWILPSLVTPLLRYIRDHLQAVSTLILRWGLSNIGRFALDLERAIRAIF